MEASGDVSFFDAHEIKKKLHEEAVVMYHFGVAGFPVGFAGVDVFFVIFG